MTLAQHLMNADVYPQFIASKIAKDARGNLVKLPCNPQGIPSSHKDPLNWMTLAHAEAAIAKLPDYYRIGYSITHETKLFFLDIDKALQSDGTWPDWVNVLCGKFKGCYMEVSQSGKGIHILGRYTGELPTHKNKNTQQGIELYTHDRYVLFGGISPRGDWNTDATGSLKSVIMEYFSETPASVAGDGPSDALTDEQVLARARIAPSAKAVFGKGATFSDLFDGNTPVLMQVYPTQTDGKEYDASSADLALANMLFAQTIDIDQVIRIMRRSALAREKWERGTYLLDTATKAKPSRSSTLFQQKQSNEHNNESQSLSDIPQEFEGCFFVKSEREIYTLQHGLVNQEGFNICFFAPHFTASPYSTFKKVAKLAGRIVDHQGFRPDLPHGTITENEGDRSINTYKALVIKQKQGDMSPFFRFFNAMIPNERDQRILLSYAAVLAQKPGVKSQWTVILQGVQGCGKSLFADFIAYACGEKYTHRAKGDEFENRFNSQWFGKTLILIEDPRLKEVRLEEVLKPLITQKTLCFEGKGKNARMGDFPANFILTVNDFELIQKRREARRLAVFMSALQTPEDLAIAGLNDATFSAIAAWKANGGNEIFAHFILNYRPDPEFDFSGTCVTAPHTSTTEEAIECSRSEIEHILIEEIEQGRIGFRRGWISSTALTDLLLQMRIRHLLPDRKRGSVLQSLGYIYHPGLPNGQTTRFVLPENKRPRLFIKKDHPSANLTDRELITLAYEKDQA